MSHRKYRTETNCLNCGSEVTGNFCSQCGQENIVMRENFFTMLWHFITDYLHFDSKFFRSLIPLFTRPGFLTREYWEGRRMQYIPPVRLFFFVTILFMISTSYFYGKYGTLMKNSMIKNDKEVMLYDSAKLANMNDTSKVYLNFKKKTVTIRELKELQLSEKGEYDKFQAGVDFVFRNLKYVTFFLLPVYALLFKILYVRRKSFYIDHVIYVMHFQTFSYIILSILFVLPLIFPAILNSLLISLIGIIFLYILFSLRYLYHQAWWKTTLKAMISTFLIFFTTVLTIVVSAAVNAFVVQA